MPRLLGLLAPILALTLFTGCARSKITTEVRANGSYVRTIELTGPAKQEGGMQVGSTLEETFAVPSDAAWTKSERTKASDRIVTLVRTFAAGAGSKGDLRLKEGEGEKVALSNEVTVKRSGTSRIEYTETLTWSGEPPKIAGGLKGEDLAQLKAALPKGLATDENANAVAMKAATMAVPVLFGPGDPLLAIGLMHPDLAERRATQRLGTLMTKALEEQFGEKLTVAQRREIARKLITTTFSAAKPSKPDPGAGPDKKSGAGLVPLMFVLKGPGKVVSSNGEVDELTGEVYWALFPEAASMKPVTLTAVWDAAAK
jgi:hypothetical protein